MEKNHSCGRCSAAPSENQKEIPGKRPVVINDVPPAGKEPVPEKPAYDKSNPNADDQSVIPGQKPNWIVNPNSDRNYKVRHPLNSVGVK